MLPMLQKEVGMTKRSRVLVCSALLLVALFFLAGCGSGTKEAGPQPPLETATKVGSESCTNTCHATTVDVTGTQIAPAWAATTHTTDGNVQCENCHGPASLHWGVGPIPFPNPQADQCNACHGFTGFNATAHANANKIPDSTFSQIPTPVSTPQHIQECSVCHNSSQRFVFNSDGSLAKPDPNNLPNPTVSCASCHNAHEPEFKVSVPQRSAPVGYPVFRNYVVDSTGAQSKTGSPFAGFIFQPNGAVQADGTVDITRVVGTNNELGAERVCSPCHTRGNYLNSGGPTHQQDIYTQWRGSAHGERNAPAFAEFSANPTAYVNPNTGKNYTTADAGHQSLWPYDMALGSNTGGGGQKGATASTKQNAAVPVGVGSNDNFPCYKCHNGLTSIAYQDNVQGTSSAPVVFGDEPVTCVTCHDPHTNVGTQSKNTRQPVIMTNYSTSSVTITGNVFLDTQPVPLDKTKNATICVYCHQGRESGYTLYKTKLAPGKTITGSFFNPHYLGTGAMLWGANAYEYTGKSYSVNEAHQTANCITCHMSNPTADNKNGGHSWNPNVVSCNTSSCHGSFNAVAAESGTASPDVDTYRANFDTNNYTGDPNGQTLSIAQSIQSLENKLVALLKTKGIEYDDLNYPYAFKAGLPHTSANAFTAWTPPAYKATFNLQFIVKGLPSAATSQLLVPNASAAVHNYKYCIQLLLDSYADLNGSPLAGATRPAGTRPATVYGPGQ